MLLNVGAMVLRREQRDEAAEEMSTKSSLFTKDFVVSTRSSTTIPASLHDIYPVHAEGTPPLVFALSIYHRICYRYKFEDFGNEIVSGSDDTAERLSSLDIHEGTPGTLQGSAKIF